MSGSCYWVDHAAPVDQVATVEPATPVDQVIATVEPATPVDPVIATVEPTTPVIYAVLPGAESAAALELTVAMQAFDHQALHDLEAAVSNGSPIVGYQPWKLVSHV